LATVRTERGLHQRDDWPAWTGWLIAGIMAFLAVSTVAMFDGTASLWAALLLGAATVPFVLDATGRLASAPVHAIGVITPLAIFSLAGEPLGLYEPEGHAELALVALLFYAGQLCATARTSTLVPGLVAILAVIIGHGFADPYSDGEMFWLIGVVVAATVGFFMRTLIRALREVQAAQAQLARQAAVDERQRIAREVHDVIAHSLTVTMLHLTAARLAVNRGDPAAANEALEEAERTGRQSLNDIRGTIGLLRDADADATEAALPSAADVPDLIARYRTAGLKVDCDVDGDLVTVPPATGLATYRIVQEALANAVRHTPGATAEVDVTVNGGVTLRIASKGGVPRDDPGTGMGVSGMCERAEALGGHCTAGPEGEGWVVEAAIPAVSA
jgi:signal transduction histidine kinase